MAIDVAQLTEIEDRLTEDTLTDEELTAAVHAAGLPELARVLRSALVRQ